MLKTNLLCAFFLIPSLLYGQNAPYPPPPPSVPSHGITCKTVLIASGLLAVGVGSVGIRLGYLTGWSASVSPASTLTTTEPPPLLSTTQPKTLYPATQRPLTNTDTTIQPTRETIDQTTTFMDKPAPPNTTATTSTIRTTSSDPTTTTGASTVTMSVTGTVTQPPPPPPTTGASTVIQATFTDKPASSPTITTTGTGTANPPPSPTIPPLTTFVGHCSIYIHLSSVLQPMVNNLTKLTIVGNHPGESCELDTALVDTLKQINSLTHLDIPSHEFPNNKLLSIFAALTELQEIILRGGFYGDDGLVAPMFVPVFRNMRNLHQIYLCGIRADKIDTIATAYGQQLPNVPTFVLNNYDCT